jgi:tRNA uridine 5-carboxymethylaminomethyl modification enzyme
LTESGRKLGLVDDERWHRFEKKRVAIAKEQVRLEQTWLQPGIVPETLAIEKLGQAMTREYNLMQLLRRPEVNYVQLMDLFGFDYAHITRDVIEQVEIQAKYSGYIERQAAEIERNRYHEDTLLPVQIDYTQVRGLSSEMVQKFSEHRPHSLGHASRIPGVTPAAISLLRIYIKKYSAQFKKSA